MATNKPSTALTPVPPAQPTELYGLTRERLELVKRTIAKDTTDDEFALFMSTAQRMGLDPFARQIFCVKRYSKKEQRSVMSIQIAIDGYRSTAAKTGELDGQEGPFWCGDDGVWRDVWLRDEPPAAAKVLVYRKGCARPFTGVATYLSYVQKDNSGDPNAMWERGPDFMLAKCAEAVALRKAFPSEIGGTTIPEEVGEHDEKPTAFGAITPPARTAPQVPPTNTTPATSASSAAKPPASGPTTTKTIDRTPLADAVMAELRDAIKKTTNRSELKKLGLERVRDKPMSDEQRDELRHLSETQLDLIEDAERAEQEHASGGDSD